MQKYLFLVFSILYCTCIYPESETILEIPVVPRQAEEKNFENAEKSVNNPSETNVNTEVVPAQINNGSTAINKSVMNIASQIKSGQAQQYGGENGFLEIHLRGARAFEPSFYFNGLPLTSALNGSQNLNLLPSSGIASMNVYPDNAPFWLSTMGIGGDVDIISCKRNNCFENNHFKLSSTVGSYHYRKVSLSHSLSISKQTDIFESVEYTKSLEDYPVFNNNNSTLNAGNGEYQNLQNNNFTSFGTAAGVSSFYEPMGKLNLNVAFGSRDQGIPGAIGTVSTTRLNENLAVATLKSEKFFPNNGVQWTNQIGALLNHSHISSDISTFSNQGSRSNSYNLQAKSLLIIPTNFILAEQTGFSFELLSSNTDVQTNFITDPNQIATDTNANRLEYRPSIFEGLVQHVKDNVTLSANANAWVSGAQDNTKVICYSGLVSTCNEGTSVDNPQPIYGYTLALQSEIYFLIPYFRYTDTQRRPYLAELYGSPGGTLANNSLLNEQSKKEEFGINFLFGDTGIFHADDKNLIFLQQASPVTSQYINLQSGTRNGYFLNLNYDITRYWNTTVNYQYLNAIMVQNGVNLVVPRSPKHTATVATSLKDIPLTTFFNHNMTFASYANAQYESPFYIDTANIDEMRVPIVYNAGMSFAFANPCNKTMLSLDVFNLTDEKFSSLYNSSGFVLQVNSNGYLGVPPPGRRFYVTLTSTF